MRLQDILPLNEVKAAKMPLGTKHSLPHAAIIPKMDLYYEFYKFVTNMACHPELENQDFTTPAMRDVPFAVAYTPQEFEMIQATAKRMGFDIEEVAFKGSKELPDTYKSSPVAEFNMVYETVSSVDLQQRIAKVQKSFLCLTESERLGKLMPEIENTMSPTMTIPELINSDTYKQYRYNLALAAARAVANGEVEFDAMSAWNEALTGIAYTAVDLETFRLANKLMNVNGVMLSNSQSHEPKDSYTASPVMKFDMKLTESETIRNWLDILK